GITLRMGLHSGPVYRVPDINSNSNLAGGGINLAQRVMDCGDAGHILVSSAVAEVLGELGQWTNSLHDIGETVVKHGLRLHLFNLYDRDFGNSNVPRKLQPREETSNEPQQTPPAVVRIPPSDAFMGKTVSHYRILRKLGRGGMGIVYEAQDA